MEDSASGATEQGVGDTSSQDQNQDQDKKDVDTSERVVLWDNHKRALDDMHKYKKHAIELETKLAELEDQKLREKEQWKELAEKREAEAAEWKKKAEEGQSLFLNTQKYNAVKNAALKAGMLQEAIDDLDLLDLDEVTIETTSTGRYVVHGVSDFVKALKARRPYWFGKEGPPNVDSGGGTTKPDPDKPVTPADVVQAEQDMYRGKITKDEYVAIFKRYREQKLKERKE